MVLGKEDIEAVAKRLSVVEKDVNVLAFRSDGPECVYCNVLEELLGDVHTANSKFNYRVLDVKSAEARKYGVKYGATMLFEEKPNIRYMGLPSGYEFSVFLGDIVAVGTGSVNLDLSAAKNVSRIDTPVDIYVFVTPTCPYCPGAVESAHKFAFVNPNITAYMVEATEFPALADEYGVFGVPKTVILRDGAVLDMWEGNIGERAFAERLARAVKGE